MIVAMAIGNTLRGDDGAGKAMAQALAERLPGVEVVETAELLPEHAELLARADGVLFLDASVSGPTGEVRAEVVRPGPARNALLHALLPEELLGLAHVLHGRAPPAALVTISGRDFSFREALSPEVQAALPTAHDRAYQLALALLSATPR